MADKIKVWESPRNMISQTKTDDGSIYYRLNKEDQKAEHIEVYRQVGERFIFPFEGNEVQQLELEGFDGFDGVPWHVISVLGFGFSENSINYFFKYKIPDTINKVVLSANKPSEQQGTTLRINLYDLDELVSDINLEKNAHSNTKQILVSNFLSENFPDLNLKYKQRNNNKALILNNLNDAFLKTLVADDIEKIGSFYVKAAQRYKRPDLVRRLSTSLQKNAQLLTLLNVIERYKKLLENNPLEGKWQEFFEENILLFDNRYIKSLGRQNINLGTTKYPDLTLVDIYGYIDFYELKRSSTKLLRYDESHNTYYWSADLAKAIAQASDYLQKAKDNALGLSASINSLTVTNDEQGLNVGIVSPRAIIVAGSSKELENDNMNKQFKALREGMKDIEFLLYDEILQRLQNLLDNVSAE